MRVPSPVPLTAVLLLALLVAACSDEAHGREIAIVASGDACAPARVEAASGERLTLSVTNESRGDRMLEGVEGATLEPLLIAVGETRSASLTMPASGSAKVRCYAQGGASTVIEIVASASASPTAP